MDKQINKLFFIINGTQRKIIFNLNIVTKNNSLETCARLLFMLLQGLFASARLHREHKKFCYRKV